MCVCVCVCVCVRERERDRLTGTSDIAVPSESPFFVKNMVLSTRLNPQPTTSPVVKVGPYGWPVPEQLKTHPSSAW